MQQSTIAKRVESIGIGLHKGEPVRITLDPLEADQGIVFHRSDIGTSIKAVPQNVVDTQMATVIGDGSAFISTIEHLLSAVYSYGIDNILISVDSNEVPVMDGSGTSFCMMLDEAGVRKLDKNKSVLIIKQPVAVFSDDKYAKIFPSNKVTYDFKIDFSHPIIGQQHYSFEFSKKAYIDEISKARTFGFLKDVQYLRSKGLALGGSLENAIVMDDKKILNPEGLRFEKEFVKHKILDAIGDLALLGAPVIGSYESFAGSHHLNHLLTKEILKDPKNYEIKTIENVAEFSYAEVFS